MNQLKKSYHFLGSITFAIILIAFTASVVIYGTIVEAKTGSHKHAAGLTYNSPLFSSLLLLFFINILFSALRRWPFKFRHIPFLTTHLGLLMVIGGTIIKNLFGIQGSMVILEGSGTNEIFLQDSHALLIEKQAPLAAKKKQSQIYPIDMTLQSGAIKIPDRSLFPELALSIKGMVPNSCEYYETWIKDNWAFITGFPPFPAYSWDFPPEKLPESASLPLGNPSKHWTILAVKTRSLEETLVNSYVQGTTLTLSANNPGICPVVVSLAEALKGKIEFADGFAEVSLDLPYSFERTPTLNIQWKKEGLQWDEKIKIPLAEESCLKPINLAHPYLCQAFFNADLSRQPGMLIIQDQSNTALFSFDDHGRIHKGGNSRSRLQSVFAYNGGFGGYTVQAHLPYYSYPSGRDVKELADMRFFTKLIQNELNTHAELSLPLELLNNACKACRVNFAEMLTLFLYWWKESGRLILPNGLPSSHILTEVLSHLNWNAACPDEMQRCLWTAKFLGQLEAELIEGSDLIHILKTHKWPFIQSLEEKRDQEESFPNTSSQLALIAGQMFSIAGQLPPFQEDSPDLMQQGSLLSAYLKAFDIDPFLMEEALEKIPVETRLSDLNGIGPSFIDIECPLSFCYLPAEPSPKWEDNRPTIDLEISLLNQKELVSLIHNPYRAGLKIPILQGQYLVRFQPITQDIPYRVRLRSARQINYPGTYQPYSYESDVIIFGKDGNRIEKTLSMNHVHETPDGYRFYLAGITVFTDGIAQATLAVNYDPAKYILTYPGGCIIALGIILLFWFKKVFSQK